MAHQPDFTLASLQTIKINAQVNDDVKKGGQIALTIAASLSIADGAEEADVDHPLRLELTTKADGQNIENREDVIFTCSCTVVALYALPQGVTIKHSEINNSINGLIPPIFVHARQQISDLLMWMGVKSDLPLNVSMEQSEA